MAELPPFDDFVPELRFQPVVAISPDGTAVAYVSNQGGQYNLWTHPLRGDGEATQLTAYTDQSVRAVAWSPSGTTLAYSADRDGDEQYQIYVIAATGGEPRRVSTTDGRQHDLAARPFTPDGKQLVYGGNDRDETVQDVLVHDLATGSVRRVESVPGELLSPVEVSPDGRWLLGVLARSNTDMDVFVVDLADAAARHRVLTGHDGEEVNAPMRWFPDGSGFWLLTNRGRDFTALARGDVAGAIEIVEAPDWDVEGAVSSADGTAQVWIVNENGTSVPYARHGNAEPQRLDIGDGVFAATDLSPDGTTIAGLFGTGTQPGEVVTVDVATSSLTALTDSRPPALTRITAVNAQLVDYPTHDNRRIPGWLYRPAGDGPRPVVLSIHGGPQAQELAVYAYSGLYQYLMSRGIGVFAPNVRGSTGYGVSYTKLIDRDWGGAELGDFEHAVKYLRGLDWVDADRIAVFGGSFGGFATLSCVSRLPDLFAAGVSIVGPSNLVTFARAVPPTWRALMAKWVGDPETEADFLLERSPITYVDQIRAPLMVVQGANDPRVVKAESDQIVEALRARGVEVRYDVYDDEGHGFTKRSNEIKALGDVADFLVAHLA
jgi:dipeptidyl aminopeptidase/acylaminoacyl peptidase